MKVCGKRERGQCQGKHEIHRKEGVGSEKGGKGVGWFRMMKRGCVDFI